MSSPLYATWSVSVSTQIRRISSRFTTLADIQLAMGILLVVLLLMPRTLFSHARSRLAVITLAAPYPVRGLGRDN
jgi:hypothetical protein